MWALYVSLCSAEEKHSNVRLVSGDVTGAKGVDADTVRCPLTTVSDCLKFQGVSDIPRQRVA